MLFGLNFHIDDLFRRFEIGRKLVKNQSLTPLLRSNFSISKPHFRCKVPEIRAKRYYLAWTFMLMAYFEDLKLVEN